MKNPFPSIIAEMKKVEWPTRKELLTLLVFTVVVSGVVAALMLGLDVLFVEVRNVLLNL